MNVVVTNLIGGLGNQMFQYAAGRALALRNGAELKLDLMSFETYSLRRYELEPLSVAASIANESSVPTSPPAWRRVIGRLGGESKRFVDAISVYTEPHFHFDPAFTKRKSPVYLRGYWQSERYFCDVADIIRREFTPREPFDWVSADIAQKIGAVNAVSLHVRRGDYVNNPTTHQVHGVCSPDYYQSALELIKQRIGDPHLFVFSDDGEWVRKNMRFDIPVFFVIANPLRQDYRDMQLMARCKHHILANSSFSWWGAWLNPSPDKVVIAPKKWFQIDAYNTRDLFPRTWLTI